MRSLVIKICFLFDSYRFQIYHAAKDGAAAKQDEDIKAAKDAAQAAGAAAKNLFGGIGSALGQAVNKAQPATKVLDRKDSSKNVGFGDDREKGTDELSDDTPTVVKPNFVKHINKTRTMSSRQKWDWAFDKILMVSNIYFVRSYFYSLDRTLKRLDYPILYIQ